MYLADKSKSIDLSLSLGHQNILTSLKCYNCITFHLIGISRVFWPRRSTSCRGMDQASRRQRFKSFLWCPLSQMVFRRKIARIYFFFQKFCSRSLPTAKRFRWTERKTHHRAQCWGTSDYLKITRSSPTPPTTRPQWYCCYIVHIYFYILLRLWRHCLDFELLCIPF